jgi:choline dehydrogenase-like flavoprotein
LELSGIGNPSILSQVGIKCLVKNVRVGENFQDHIAAGFGYELVEGEKSLDILQNDAVLKAAMTEYTTSKSGPLSSGGAAIGFMSYADVATPEEVAALQESIMSNEYSGHSEPTKKLIAESIADHSYGSIQVVLLPASLNLTSLEGQKEFFQPPADQEGKQGFCIGGAVQRPVSVGSIHITTSDPLTDPAIDPGYFHHPADVEIMSKCLEIVAKTASASPLKEKIKRVYHPRDGLDIDNKKQVEEYMRNYCATEYHPIGTVAMGLEGEGACDDRLRVWGCKGLRVVDSSVIPLHVSGNIVATVYAIGEKGADLIKEDWGL